MRKVVNGNEALATKIEVAKQYVQDMTTEVECLLPHIVPLVPASHM